jgi:DegV family protein with EDD domain
VIKVVVDSASSLSASKAASLGLTLIPLKVQFGDDSFLDGVTLGSEEFYRRLTSDHTLPRTSQPSSGDFYNLFRDLTADGSQVLCIVISHQLSGTLSSAEAARDMLPERSIHIFDSLNVSIGEALLGLAAAEMVRSGLTMENILARLERMRTQTHCSFVPDTLEYLQRGGRISNAAALMGSMLQIKPVLDLHNGRIEAAEKVRTHHKAMERMMAIMGGRFSSEPPVWAGIAHCNCSVQMIANLEQEIRSHFNCVHMLVTEAGPTIATHGGPGTIGMALSPVIS